RALCLSLFDDDALGRLAAWPRGRAAAAPASGGACLLDGGARELPPAPPARPLPRLQRWITVPFAACVLWIGAVQACDAVRGPEAQSHGGWPARAARAVAEPLQPFALVNPYGLFRVMTRERPELIVEGSNDGLEWKAYPFRWKPGEPLQAPRWVQPHMPRLDWRMWFAALSPQGNAEWLVPFLQRLLEGEPKVLDLLSSNPFPQQPPRCVRVLLYQYRFSTPAERAATGAWWQRELQGELLRLPPAVPR
ncbi:MAG: lipase maturation factor family protein, partial [Planctomycetota bacterium]